jgi:ring-1,2-phenylacetyl-CoA epoxidase subunit PaaE
LLLVAAGSGVTQMLSITASVLGADDEPPAPLAAERDDVTSAGPTSEVTLVLDGRTTTFSVPRHHTVLDGAQQVRPDLPFAYKGGVCGTCRALVTHGRADMRRDYALDPAEVSADQTQHVPAVRRSAP